MKPLHIVITINITFLVVWGLLFTLAFNRPEMIPLFVGFQAAFNFFMGLLGWLDQKKNIAIAFFGAFVVTALLCGLGFYLIDHFFYLIKSDEMITS